MKITQYEAMTNPQPDDLAIVVDVNDTSMAPTGTDKKTTLAQAAAGGLVIMSPLEYGVDITGATNCYSAMTAMFAAAGALAPATVLILAPAGIYNTSGGWVVPSNVIFRGAGAMGSSVTGIFNGTVIQPTSGFSGSYLFSLSQSDNNPTNGAPLSNIMINGSNYTTEPVDAIRITGPAMCQLNHVAISFMSGWGVNTILDLSAGEIGAFGQIWTDVRVDSCGTSSGGGVNLNYAEDSTFLNCYIIGNTGPGWQLCGCDNTKFIGCRAEYNSTYGFWVTNASGVDWTYATGWVQFIGCSTDRNNFSGFRIDGTWQTGGGNVTGPCGVLISNLVNRRDGASNTGTAGTYAGLDVDYSGAVSPSVGLPVIVSGIGQMTGNNDGGGGNVSPRYGLRVNALGNAPLRVNNGMLWGYGTAVTVSGTATSYALGTEVVQAGGANWLYTA